METLLADLRYALRTMRRNLGFTVIALAALALGIGANTAIFTVVDGVLLQPLPYPQPDRIMKLGRQFPTGVGYSISIPKYMAWRQNDVFDAMALYDFGALAMNVGSGNPPQPISRERTMTEVLAGAVARQSFNTVLLSIFAGVALVLAAIGIYGLMSYSVDQRRQEIGIRMALGADRGTMLRVVLREGMTLAGLGVVLGLLLAYGLTRLLASLLFGVKASDPFAFAAVAGILTMVALVAAYIPARRATTVDPAIALRYE
jgi:ABC-type antimicrobial peptide transport system permease subunit